MVQMVYKLEEIVAVNLLEIKERDNDKYQNNLGNYQTILWKFGKIYFINYKIRVTV